MASSTQSLWRIEVFAYQPRYSYHDSFIFGVRVPFDWRHDVKLLRCKLSPWVCVASFNVRELFRRMSVCVRSKASFRAVLRNLNANGIASLFRRWFSLASAVLAELRVEKLPWELCQRESHQTCFLAALRTVRDENISRALAAAYLLLRGYGAHSPRHRDELPSLAKKLLLQAFRRRF